MTEGSSLAARMGKGPPHGGQGVMSRAKTRVSHWAQLIRARVEAEVSSPFPSAMSVFGAGSASPGTICDRRAALGASTP